MFIKIECTKKKAEIEHIEFGNRQITFFLSDFFYLNFENDNEKELFFSEFLKNSLEQYSEEESYVELDEALICRYEGFEGITVIHDTKLNVKSYKFLKHNNQVFNREIKKICRDAGIIEEIKVSKKMNSKLVPDEDAKCEFISSHTMRRTFITLLSNMTEITNIQAVSGHKDIKVLTDYIKRNDKELNSVRACFNDVFSRSIKETPSNQPAKVKATIIKTRVISH